MGYRLRAVGYGTKGLPVAMAVRVLHRRLDRGCRHSRRVLHPSASFPDVHGINAHALPALLAQRARS